jgi:uncharacterized membrane protein
MRNLSTMQMGLVVAVFLAILTIVEYIFAVEINDDVVRFVGLSVAALGKAWLIMQFFMHLGNVFRPSAEGHH